jgi:hypothetical protein
VVREVEPLKSLVVASWYDPTRLVRVVKEVGRL